MAYTHTPTCKCMCVHTHTPACTHTKVVVIYLTPSSTVCVHQTTSLLFVLVPGILPVFLQAKNKCLLIKLKAVSLGIYFWCTHQSQSYPHPKGPYCITISFKELLASSPGRINISPVFTAYCLYSSYNFLLGTVNTTHISYHHAHQECILLKGGDGVLFIYVTVDFPKPQ